MKFTVIGMHVHLQWKNRQRTATLEAIISITHRHLPQIWRLCLNNPQIMSWSHWPLPWNQHIQWSSDFTWKPLCNPSHLAGSFRHYGYISKDTLFPTKFCGGLVPLSISFLSLNLLLVSIMLQLRKGWQPVSELEAPSMFLEYSTEPLLKCQQI